MTMLVESGRLPGTEETVPDVKPENEYVQLARQLGLNRLAPIEGSLEGARAFYHELVGDELAVWQWFLPTRYSAGRGWSDYSHDVPSVEVLREIAFAESLGVFPNMQIWTAEKVADPMAVGAIRADGKWHFFEIVRWGESLAPFEAIREARQRWLQTNTVSKNRCVSFLTVMVVAFLALAILVNPVFLFVGVVVTLMAVMVVGTAYDSNRVDRAQYFRMQVGAPEPVPTAA